MPSKSKAQMRAMHAAAEGRGTIGIPKKVGKEFAKADHARHLAKGKVKLPPRAKPKR